MKLHSSAAAALALALCQAAMATGQKTPTHADPASAVAPSTTRRTLKFDTHQAVPATLTLRQAAPVVDGWSPQFRFAGQAELHTCALHLPKVGQLVRRGDTVIGTIVCATPWQLDDDGLAFEAFADGIKVAEGTLRP